MWIYYIFYVMIDLHTHSNASDGELSPTELINQATLIGLQAIALTDHDTISGLDEAKKRANECNILFIPGVEIDVDFSPGELHLLALNLDMQSIAPIEQFLEERCKQRVIRNQQIIQLMQDDGIDISLASLRTLSGGGITGRLHFAQWLINSKRAKNITDAFEHFLGLGQSYYVPKNRPSLEETLNVIHESGGKSVLAHPKSLWVSWGRLEKLLIQWKEMGLDGIEALHSGNSLHESKRFTMLAESCNLFVSGGSDFHGNYRPDRRLGYGANGMTLSTQILKNL